MALSLSAPQRNHTTGKFCQRTNVHNRARLYYAPSGPAVDPESSKAVLEKGLLLCPELAVESKVNVVGHIVGLRPTRDNGPRIESEIKGKWFYLYDVL